MVSRLTVDSLHLGQLQGSMEPFVAHRQEVCGGIGISPGVCLLGDCNKSYFF